MRHQRRIAKLNRNEASRKALIKNLLANFFIHGQIQTTLSKAKAIKGLADRLIYQAKQASLHRRGLIESFLQNKSAVEKLFQEIGPRVARRTSGFTRIIRLGQRRGDGAQVAKIELVDQDQKEAKKVAPTAPKKK